MNTILRSQLPCDEAILRVLLDDYQAAVAAHALTVGVPAPFPEYEILRVLQPGFQVIDPEEPEPGPEQDPEPKTQFTSLEFLDRFTDDEQLTVVTATLQSAQVKLWYDKMLAASYVDINDPRTAVGIDTLIAVGLIAADRRDAILAPEEALTDGA